MRITGNFIKLNRQEPKDIAEFCIRVLNAPQATDPISRILRKQEEFRVAAMSLLRGLVAETELWADRFFEIVQRLSEEPEKFAQEFSGIAVPRWFIDQSARSQSYEQYRKLQRHQAQAVRRYLHCVDIAEVAKNLGVELTQIGVELPLVPGSPSGPVQEWLNCRREFEQDKRAKTRGKRRQANAEVRQEVEAIPMTATQLALRKTILELKETIRMRDYEIIGLKGRANLVPGYEKAVAEAQKENARFGLIHEVEALKVEIAMDALIRANAVKKQHLLQAERDAALLTLQQERASHREDHASVYAANKKYRDDLEIKDREIASLRVELAARRRLAEPVESSTKSGNLIAQALRARDKLTVAQAEIFHERQESTRVK